MVEERECENHYRQIIGKYEKLKDFTEDSFDIIVCHNVLEFAPERPAIVKEFSRLLKTDGILSVVKNNGHGRIMRKAIIENNVNEAINLLEGGYIANTFGRVVLYDPEDLVKWSDNLRIKKILGLDVFYGLQPDSYIKNEQEWINKMFDIEMRVCNLEPYKNISLYNHVLLRKA